MSYFNMLGLDKEPFSTSPDPVFFYSSPEHKAVFYKLRIAIRLRRGLSVVLGDIGTGKTTLARTLFKVLRAEEKDTTLFSMILNPIFNSDKEFLLYLAELFRLNVNLTHFSSIDCIKKIESYLFQKGMKESKTVVLLIDEAQKLSLSCLEILRVLLNYETNEYKLLQLILMGQMELLPRIKEVENFWDRISLKYLIHPLGREETLQMINFRLKKAGCDNAERGLFSEEAIDEIYNYSEGYPRKITMLCHSALETLVMEEKEVVNGDIVRGLVEREMSLMQIQGG